MNADSLLHWLMRTSLEASVLILAVLGLRWALGQRLSPAWRIGLWMLVGAKLLLPAFVPAGFGLGAWMKTAEKPAMTSPQARQPDTADNKERQTQTAVVALRLESQPDGSMRTTWAFSPKAALVGVWLLGAAGILLAALIRQRRFEKMLRMRRPGTDAHLITLVGRLAQRAALKKAVRIVLMPAGTAPAMVGVRQPTLLLPEDWQARFDENSLRHVVAHELCHVKQGDLAWNWAALAVQAVHWFNPLVWFVVSRFQADRELRCDAGALALLAPTERLDYGHTLLRIQESFFAPPAIAGLAPCVRNHPTLRQRILMIASPTTRQPWLQAALVLTLGGLVCYSFTTSARAQEKEVPPKVRTRDTGTDKTIVPGNSGADGVKKPGDREREGDGAARKPGMTERDGEGGAKKPGARDGEGGAKKPGARDGEGERKPGARDGEGERKPGMRDGEKPRTGEREGDGARKTGEREGDGARKTGERDGEGTKKPGMRDGERPRTGERNGEKPRSGERDGERPRTGERDGEKPRGGERDGERPRTGERDGEKPRAGGERDGQPREGRAREGERPATTSRSTGTGSDEIITLHVTSTGDVKIGEEEVSINRLRGHLSTFLPEHPGAKIIISADESTPFKTVTDIMDAVRDNGNKNVEIKVK